MAVLFVELPTGGPDGASALLSVGADRRVAMGDRFVPYDGSRAFELVVTRVLVSRAWARVERGRLPDCPERVRRTFAAEETRLHAIALDVFRRAQGVWNEILPSQGGRAYVGARLILFANEALDACGRASRVTGPFYCPFDQAVWLDLTFLEDLRYKLGESDDFAQAYVIAHELGHYLQHLLGTIDWANARASATGGKADPEARVLASERLELEADLFAGVCLHHAVAAGWLRVGDIEGSIRAVSELGDDRLQAFKRGFVVPDSFTHGSLEQRLKSFKLGFETGSFGKDRVPSRTK